MANKIDMLLCVYLSSVYPLQRKVSSCPLSIFQLVCYIFTLDFWEFFIQDTSLMSMCNFSQSINIFSQQLAFLSSLEEMSQNKSFPFLRSPIDPFFLSGSVPPTGRLRRESTIVQAPATFTYFPKEKHILQIHFSNYKHFSHSYTNYNCIRVMLYVLFGDTIC